MGNSNQELLYTNQENVWAAQMSYCKIDNTLLGDIKRSLSKVREKGNID